MKVCENVQKNEKMYFFFFEHVYISNVKQWGLKDQLQKKTNSKSRNDYPHN